jgi:hypothetical protein
VARWRAVAAVAVLAALAFFGIRLAPIYMRNQQFQSYVEEVTGNPQSAAKSDDLLRTWLVDKAAALELPVRHGDVRIRRTADGLGIDVRYVVRVDLPVYTVDLHFRPGAGAR